MIAMVFLFLGIVLCIAGTVAASITGSWTIAPITLSIVGIVLLVLGLWLRMGQRKFWQQRSTQQRTKAIAKTIWVLSILGLINWVGIVYSQQWDLTENQINTLSKQSQNIVAELEQPLEVLIFDRQLDPELENLLQNYRRYSDRFRFELIDPEQQIGLAQQYGVQSLGEVYLRYGEKQQKLGTGNVQSGVLTETQLTNGIAKIRRDRPLDIYFLQGHGEASLELVEGGLAQAIQNLTDRGSKVSSLNLAQSGKIPDDADLIVVAGATRKLLVAEVSTLQQYLKTGGNLLLLLSPNIDLGIEPILQNWGIELDRRLIVDGSGASSVMGFGPAVVIVNNYGKHPITASFDDSITLFPEASPLKIIEKAEVSSTPLAITSQQTWAENDLQAEEITFDASTDLSGPLNVAIASIRQQPQPARLVVFGSTAFATNGWFEQQLNGDLLLNAINWLVGEDRDTLAIRPQEPANRRLNLSSLQAGIISWLASRIMPFLALVVGVLLWWKSR